MCREQFNMNQNTRKERKTNELFRHTQNFKSTKTTTRRTEKKFRNIQLKPSQTFPHRIKIQSLHFHGFCYFFLHIFHLFSRSESKQHHQQFVHLNPENCHENFFFFFRKTHTIVKMIFVCSFSWCVISYKILLLLLFSVLFFPLDSQPLYYMVQTHWCDCTCARPNLLLYAISSTESQSMGDDIIPSRVFRFGKFCRFMCWWVCACMCAVYV